MAKLYWVTFRIADVGNWKARYGAVQQAVKELTLGSWWTDPTSFIVFQSDQTIDTIAAHIRAALDPDQDIAVVGMPNIKSARVVGNVEDPDLFTLWDWIQAV